MFWLLLLGYLKNLFSVVENACPPSGRQGEDLEAGRRFTHGKEQVDHWSEQMGRPGEWYHHTGQEDVHDHDGDERLYQVAAIGCSHEHVDLETLSTLNSI